MEAGTGKTCTVIQIIREKCQAERRLLRSLILCPQVVIGNWVNELKKFSQITQITPLVGPGSKRVSDFMANNSAGHIFVTNYEALENENLYQLFVDWAPELMVADESHRIKNPSGVRTKKAVGLAQMAKYRYILTGTPVLQSAQDLFSQVQFLDGGKMFGKNFFVFRGRYFYNKNAGAPSHVTWPDWQIRPGALDEISKLIDGISVKARKSECMDLPPMLYKTVEVDLGKKQSKHYEDMKKEFITFLGDKACTAQLAVTKALRLQQIASGFIRLESGQEVVLDDNPRLSALKDLLIDLVVEGKNKVIIWAVYRANYAQIRDVLDALKISYRELHGEINPRARDQAISDFANDAGVKVMLGNPGAGGIGVNLVAASYAIYYSRDFSLEHDIQSEARNYRGGSEVHDKITRIDIIARGTIDYEIAAALSRKQAISDQVLRNIATRL